MLLHIITETHRATGSSGLVVEVERGHVTRWVLADDYAATLAPRRRGTVTYSAPPWTSANLPTVARMVQSFGRDLWRL
jgi:hypothetical protein